MAFVNDPIGDMLTRLRNAQGARKETCVIPHSRIKLQLAELLKKEGWIESVDVTGDAPKQRIEVAFVPGKRLTLTRISSPGRRVYRRAGDLKPVLRGHGIAVLTTSKGLKTDVQARDERLGGEVLCTVS